MSSRSLILRHTDTVVLSLAQNVFNHSNSPIIAVFMSEILSDIEENPKKATNGENYIS